jgi:hypothetical protein
MNISTGNLEGLPDVTRLKQLLRSMAMLDAILMPEWEYRYYSFNARWGEGEMMGSTRDGAGDEFFAPFNGHGTFNRLRTRVTGSSGKDPERTLLPRSVPTVRGMPEGTGLRDG